MKALHGWSTTSSNKSKMADSGHLESLALHCCIKAHAKINRKIEKAWPVALILTLNISNVVFPPKDCAFAVQDDEWRHTWKICPKNFPKSGLNRQFQAKTPKCIHRNISRTITQSNQRFEDRVRTTKHTTWVVCYYPKANSTWMTATILKIHMMSF